MTFRNVYEFMKQLMVKSGLLSIPVSLNRESIFVPVFKNGPTF